MITNKKKWISAIKILETNRSKKIKCPECNFEFLQLKDTYLKKWNKIDRLIYCTNCNSKVRVTFDNSSPSN